METGDKYGMWTVTSLSAKGNRYVVCMCACGVSKDISVYTLRNGESKSCGCSFKGPGKAPLDITGGKWGMLTALKRVEGAPKKWLFKCDCGGTREALSFNVKRGQPKCCGCTTKAAAVEVGMTFTCATGDYTVVEKLTGDKVRVRFTDGYEYNTTKGAIRIGSVRNCFAPTSYGVGYQGDGEFKSHGAKAHAYWYKMLQRAYCPVYKSEHTTYEHVTVCDEWLNYQNFAAWITKQVGYGSMGYNLEKDRLVKGNKMYHPDLCVLIPQELNKIVAGTSTKRNGCPVGTSTRPDLNGQYMARYSRIGEKGKEVYLGLFPNAHEAFLAYKVAKEAYIKERADFWRDKMDPRAYDALVSYEIEETD